MIAQSIYVSIPDYGYDYSLLVNLYLDPAGWLHELFVIWVAGIVLIDLTYHWERKSVKRFIVVRRVK